MKTVVILAAGEGSRVWPYAEVKPKVMIPVANSPIISYNVDLLVELGFEKIIIAAGKMKEQIINYYRHNSKVQIVSVGKTEGSAFSLNAVIDYIEDEVFLVIYGDTLLAKEDIVALVTRAEAGSEICCSLVSPLGEESSSEYVCCTLKDGFVSNITGHPRSGHTHRFCAFTFRRGFMEYVQTNSGIFKNVEVGMMPPLEGYLEMSVADSIRDGNRAAAVETSGYFADVDKPWHILEAGSYLVNKKCSELAGNILGDGAAIDPTAQIKGYVKLGRGSKIGRNVIINGSLIVGDDTIIDNGAIINGNAVIGDMCYIANYCRVTGGSSIGNRCVVDHCAEMAGIIMDCVYMCHYMEFYGIAGCNTDFGAATVCGDLRFDDRNTMHRIKGRRESPINHSNATYLADFCRTGVNAIIMPGCKVGPYSVVGAGVLLQEDVPNGTMILLKQELIKKPWGPEKYGW